MNNWRKRARTNREFIQAYKASIRCYDCGGTFPHYVMEFDHCRGDKTSTVSGLVSHCTLTKILKEIGKCDVVCANCHRIRTHKRGLKD